MVGVSGQTGYPHIYVYIFKDFFGTYLEGEYDKIDKRIQNEAIISLDHGG